MIVFVRRSLLLGIFNLAISIPVLDRSKAAEAASPIPGIQPTAPLKAAILA